MRSNRIVRLAVASLAPLLVTGALIAQTGVASANVAWNGGHRVLYVSPKGKPSNDDRSCRSAAFRTIQSAVNAARPGSTVVVCRGTYLEQVVLSKPLSLVGQQATIDQSGVTPTLQVNVPHVGTETIFAAVVILSSNVKFQGFTVTNAPGEGVLVAGGVTAPGVSGGERYNVLISRNTVVHNDLGGGIPPVSTYFLCQPMTGPTGQIPNDCGEGVHFVAVAFSTIRNNFIADNSGGTLLTDDTGPTHNNVVENNVVTDNASDCGITVPGHNPFALSSTGVRQPSVAGVYDNIIRNNVVTNNGVQGEGAGVLFANATAGTASYDNLVEGNYIAGNGLSGVTMHAHTIAPTAFEDLSGNVIINNTIGRNNLDGDTLDGTVTDPLPTGVLVFSAGTPVKVRIAHNHIFDNTYGIWLSKAVMARGLLTNKFINVTTPISANN
jgi:nitrous oxidase accessory protein NosD